MQESLWPPASAGDRQVDEVLHGPVLTAAGRGVGGGGRPGGARRAGYRLRMITLPLNVVTSSVALPSP
jgi:hypothetical protein